MAFMLGIGFVVSFVLSCVFSRDKAGDSYDY